MYKKVELFQCYMGGRGGRGIAVFILNCGPRWRQMFTTCPGCFTPGKEPWCTQNRKLSGLRASLDVLWTIKSFASAGRYET